MEGDAGSAGECGDWPAAVADQMVVLCDDAGKRGAYGSPVDLRRDRVEGRAGRGRREREYCHDKPPDA
jgi:hypothetical protein